MKVAKMSFTVNLIQGRLFILIILFIRAANLNFDVPTTTKLCATEETTDERVTDASLSRLSE